MPSVRLRPKSGGLGEWLGYRLDRFLALHPLIQLLSVLVAATLLAVGFGLASLGLEDDPSTHVDQGFWWAVTRMLDGGTVAGDVGFARRFVGISVTLVGMVLVAIITGAFASSFADRMRDIRRGSFTIFERKHALLLGYGTHGDVLLRELAASGLRATIVVVTAQDRETIEERVREAVAGAKHHLRIIVRRADPTSTGGVRGSAAKRARAVLILPEIEPADVTSVDPRPADPYDADDRATLRSLLAARRVLGNRKIPVIVEATGDHGRELIELCGKGSDVTIVEEGDVSTHLLIHAVRQPGVLDVVRQILALDATSVYEHAPGPFVGKTFEDAHARVSQGILIGVLRQRKNTLCPPGDLRIEGHDRLLVFANERADLRPAPSLPAIDHDKPALPRCSSSGPVHVLVVGYRRGLAKILRSLRTHFVAKLTMLAPPEHEADARSAIDASGFPADSTSVVIGRPTDPAALARACATGPTRFLLLASDAGPVSPADLDADQLVTLLHLRRLSAAQAETPAVAEIHMAETERLIAPNHATDFILLREITGMLLAQELHALCLDASAGAWLGEAFLRLLHEISTRVWLHPLAIYVPESPRPTFADILIAARRRGEVALGVRRTRARADLLPPREESFDPSDTDVVVIAAPEPRHVHQETSVTL